MSVRPLDHPLRRARLARGLTQSRLGRLARIDPSTLSRVEHGLELRDDQLRRLAGVLGVRPSDLRIDTVPS